MTEHEEQGFPKIGDPMRNVVNSLSVSDSTLTELPSDSVITGSPYPARKPSSSTGPRPGGTGVVATQSGPPSVQSTDRALRASLPAPLRTSLRSKAMYDSAFDQLLGYDAIQPKTEADREMVQEGLAILDAALVPCPPAIIMKALARLKLSVNPRNQDADDARFQRAIYCDELAEFPLDVVVEGLRKLARLEDWFPPISKVRDQCQHLVRWRRVTRDALAKALPEHHAERVSG
jgi:hypothetical protein